MGNAANGPVVTRTSGTGALYDIFRARLNAPAFRKYDSAITDNGIDGRLIFDTLVADEAEGAIERFLVDYDVEAKHVRGIKVHLLELFDDGAAGGGGGGGGGGGAKIPIAEAEVSPVVDREVDDPFPSSGGGSSVSSSSSTPDPEDWKRQLPHTIYVFHDTENCPMASKMLMRDAAGRRVADPSRPNGVRFHDRYPAGYTDIRFNDIYRSVVRTSVVPFVGVAKAQEVDDFSDIATIRYKCFFPPIKQPANPFQPSSFTRTGVENRGATNITCSDKKGGVDTTLMETWAQDLETLSRFDEERRKGTVFVLLSGDRDFSKIVRDARKIGIQVVMLHSADTPVNANMVGIVERTHIFGDWNGICDNASRMLGAGPGCSLASPLPGQASNVAQIPPAMSPAVDAAAARHPGTVVIDDFLKAKYAETKGYGFEPLQSVMEALHPMLSARVATPAKGTSGPCLAWPEWTDGAVGPGMPAGMAERAQKLLEQFFQKVLVEAPIKVPGRTTKSLREDIELRAVAKQKRVWLHIPFVATGGSMSTAVSAPIAANAVGPALTHNNVKTASPQHFLAQLIHSSMFDDAGNKTSKGILGAQLGQQYKQKYSSGGTLMEDCGEYLHRQAKLGLLRCRAEHPKAWFCQCAICLPSAAVLPSHVPPSAAVPSDIIYIEHPSSMSLQQLADYCQNVLKFRLHLNKPADDLRSHEMGKTMSKFRIFSTASSPPDFVVEAKKRCRQHVSLQGVRFLVDPVRPGFSGASGGKAGGSGKASGGSRGGGAAAAAAAGGGAAAVSGVGDDAESAAILVYFDAFAAGAEVLRAFISRKGEIESGLSDLLPPITSSAQIELLRARFPGLQAQMEIGGLCRVTVEWPELCNPKVMSVPPEGYRLRLTVRGQTQAVQRAREVFADFLSTIEITTIAIPARLERRQGLLMGYLAAAKEIAHMGDGSSRDGTDGEDDDDDDDDDSKAQQSMLVGVDRVGTGYPVPAGAAAGPSPWRMLVTVARQREADDKEELDALVARLTTIHAEYADDKVSFAEVRQDLRSKPPAQLKKELDDKHPDLYYSFVDRQKDVVTLCGARDDVNAASEWLKKVPDDDVVVFLSNNHDDHRVVRLLKMRQHQAKRDQIQALIKHPYSLKPAEGRYTLFRLSGKKKNIDELKRRVEAKLAECARSWFSTEDLIPSILPAEVELLRSEEAQRDIEHITRALGVYIEKSRNASTSGIAALGATRPGGGKHVTHPVLLSAKVGDVELRVVSGDILTLAMDAIVNPANGRMGHLGGVAAVIRRAAGEGLDRECAEKLAGRREVAVGSVIVTGPHNLTTGNHYLRRVLHAVGPEFRPSAGGDHSALHSTYKLTVRRTLQTAMDEAVEYVSFPLMGSGVYGWDSELAAGLLVEAVQEWVAQGGVLKRVTLIDVDPDKAAIMQQAVLRAADNSANAAANALAAAGAGAAGAGAAGGGSLLAAAVSGLTMSSAPPVSRSLPVAVPAPAPSPGAIVRTNSRPRPTVRRPQFLYYWQEDSWKVPDGASRWIPYDIDQQLQIEDHVAAGRLPVLLHGDLNCVPSASLHVAEGQRFARYWFHSDPRRDTGYFQEHEVTKFRRSVKREPFVQGMAPPPGMNVEEAEDPRGLSADLSSPPASPRVSSLAQPVPVSVPPTHVSPLVPVVIVCDTQRKSHQKAGHLPRQLSYSRIEVVGTPEGIAKARTAVRELCDQKRRETESVDLSVSEALGMPWDEVKQSLSSEISKIREASQWTVIDEGAVGNASAGGGSSSIVPIRSVHLSGLGDLPLRLASQALSSFRDRLALQAASFEAEIALPPTWPQDEWLHDFSTELLDSSGNMRRDPTVWAPDVQPGTEEWDDVEDEWRGVPFRPGGSGKADEPRGARNAFSPAKHEIVRIQRIQNPSLWASFVNKAKALASAGDLKNAPGLDFFAKARICWVKHATGKTDPLAIAADKDGLDMLFSATGMMGKGVYTGEDAAYSDNERFIYTDPATGLKQVQSSLSLL